MKNEISQCDLKKLLRSHFQSIKRKNPQFSLRAFAKLLKVSSTSLNLFLNGRRDLSFSSCRSLFNYLISNKVIKNSDLSELFIEFSRSRHELLMPSSSDEKEFISHWLPFAVLSLLETDNAQSNENWIARRLHVRAAIVKNVINLLFRLQLLKRDKHENLKSITGPLTAWSAEPSDYIREMQIRCLKRSIWTQNKLKRNLDSTIPYNYSNFVTAADPNKVAKVKQEIVKFRRRMEKIISTGEKTEVYMLSFDLVPLTLDFKKKKH